jgi:hypothetical protein
VAQLVIGILASHGQEAVQPESGKDPRDGGRQGRRNLRWDLVHIKYENWDFTRSGFKAGADGFGDARRPKKWSITQNSGHIDIVNTPHAIDYNWSRPPDSIVKGKPFRIRMAVSVKGPLQSYMDIKPLMDVGSWMVRVVPETGRLPELGVNAPLSLQMAVPEGMPQVLGLGPNMAGVRASGADGDKIGSDTAAEVEIQLQDTAKDFAFLAVTLNQCSRATYYYMESPVEGLPDRSKTVWIDRDYGYPGCNTMLKGKDLKIGETYTVSLNGKAVFSRKVPAEISDLIVREDTNPVSGYSSYSTRSPKRPNKNGEIPPHEWIFINTTTEPGTYFIGVDCSSSGKFELPFKVLPVSAALERSNMEDVINIYREKIPQNVALMRALSQPGRLRDWLANAGMAGLSFGAINNMFFASKVPVLGIVSGSSAYKFEAYTCGGYQGQVLALLNYLRFSDSVYERQLIDGVEYGPFQSEYACHHFVAVWPTHSADSASALGNWKDSAVILDPWFDQRPMTYDVRQYHLVKAWKALGFLQPDDAGPLGGAYYKGCYPVNGAAQYVDPFDASAAPYIFNEPVRRRILIACPVAPVLTDSAGKRIGITGDGKAVVEVDGTVHWMEGDGGGYYMFNLPDGVYTAELLGTGAGKVSVACASDEDAQVFPEFTVERAQKAAISTAAATSDWTLKTPGGAVLRPIKLEQTVVTEWFAKIKGAPAGMRTVLKSKAVQDDDGLLSLTDARGAAFFAALAPGNYSLEFEGSDGKVTPRDFTLRLGDREASFDW